MSRRGPRNQPPIKRDIAKTRHSTLLDGHETNSSKHINRIDFASLITCHNVKIVTRNVKMLIIPNANIEM